mgnify:CR=1 FL=1
MNFFRKKGRKERLLQEIEGTLKSKQKVSKKYCFFEEKK